MQYQLKSEQISLAQVFSKMEQVVDILGIEDYSVSQTTLDNVSMEEAQGSSLSQRAAALWLGGRLQFPLLQSRVRSLALKLTS